MEALLESGTATEVQKGSVDLLPHFEIDSEVTVAVVVAADFDDDAVVVDVVAVAQPTVEKTAEVTKHSSSVLMNHLTDWNFDQVDLVHVHHHGQNLVAFHSLLQTVA